MKTRKGICISGKPMIYFMAYHLDNQLIMTLQRAFYK